MRQLKVKSNKIFNYENDNNKIKGDGMDLNQEKLNSIDKRLVRVETNLENVDNRLTNVEGRLSRVEKDLEAVRIDVTEIKTYMPHLATKAEMKDFQLIIKSDMHEFKESVTKDMNALKTDINSKISWLDVKIEKTRNSIVYWLIGVAMVSGFANHFIGSLFSYFDVPHITQTNKTV